MDGSLRRLRHRWWPSSRIRARVPVREVQACLRMAPEAPQGQSKPAKSLAFGSVFSRDRQFFPPESLTLPTKGVTSSVVLPMAMESFNFTKVRLETKHIRQKLVCKLLDVDFTHSV